MKSVVRFTASNMKYGGNLYESNIDEAISDSYHLEVYYPLSKFNKKKLVKYILSPVFYIRLFFKNLLGKFDIGIYSLESCFFLSSKRKNIVVVHHFDPSNSNFLSKANQWLTYMSLFLNKQKIDKLVVVSSYWEVFFRKKGFKNVEKIYNSFDVDYFSNILSDEKFKLRVDEFRKNILDGKFSRLVYIGNSHPKKGGGVILDEIVNGNMIANDCLFVTSGYQITNPIYDRISEYKHLDLSYEDYLVLLKASDIVVTNSQFQEGWCRTAHEAMLLETAVLGSGAGGMAELLDISNQFHINNYQMINEQISVLLNTETFINKSIITNFNFSYFKKRWLDVLND